MWKYHNIFVLFLHVLLSLLLKFGSANQNGRETSGIKSAMLDPLGRYFIEWEVNWHEKTINFQITVETTGWVGLGFSSKPDFQGADLIAGGVYKTCKWILDRYIIDVDGHEWPVSDRHQDGLLNSAWVNETHTQLNFTRAFDTCDPPEDFVFTPGNVYVIWTFGVNHWITPLDPERTGFYEVNLLESMPYTPLGWDSNADSDSVSGWTSGTGWGWSNGCENQPEVNNKCIGGIGEMPTHDIS